ncbi:hypothetical protein ABZ746_23230 [Streptomyces sp. NPDC020096]
MNDLRACENAFDRLNADWALVCADVSRAEVVTGWLVEAGVFTEREAPEDLAELLAELELRDRACGRSHSDRWMAALLRHVSRPDEQGRLAARLLVQAMLPSAMRTTRSLRRDGLAFAEVAHIVIGALYEVVRTYPLQRRPRRVAANLAMDTLRLARRELRWGGVLEDTEPLEASPALRVAADDPDPYERAALAELAEEAAVAGLADPATPAEELAGTRGELVELLLWALREQVLDEQSVAAIGDHYREVADADDVAAGAAGVSAAAWRKRRSRAVQRLQQAAPRWLADAA